MTWGSPCFFPLDSFWVGLCRDENLAPAALSLCPGPGAVDVGRGQSLIPTPHPCSVLHPLQSPVPARRSCFHRGHPSHMPCESWVTSPAWQSRSLRPFPNACPTASHQSSVPVSPCAGVPLLPSEPRQFPGTCGGFGACSGWHGSDTAAVPSPAGAALPVSRLSGASEPLEIS